MNKVKMFFIAAALVLVTAGVFAGKAKFVTNELVAYNGTTSVELAPSYTNFQTSGTTPAVIQDNSGTYYGVYSFTSPSSYTRLYSTSAW